MRPKQLAGDVEVFDVGYAQQHDRQVAGNAHRPKTGLATAATQDRVGGRSQRRSGIQQMARDPLEQAGFGRIDAEVVELHLRLGPGQRGRTLERGGVAMLVDEIEHRRPRRCNDRPEGDADDRAGCHTHTAAQSEDRIEHGADSVGQRPAVDHRDRPVDVVAAAEEARPIGLDLWLSHRLAVDDCQMRGPDFLLCR